MTRWESLMAIILQINPFGSDASLMRPVKTHVRHLRIWSHGHSLFWRQKQKYNVILHVHISPVSPKSARVYFFISQYPQTVSTRTSLDAVTVLKVVFMSKSRPLSMLSSQDCFVLITPTAVQMLQKTLLFYLNNDDEKNGQVAYTYNLISPIFEYVVYIDIWGKQTINARGIILSVINRGRKEACEV